MTEVIRNTSQLPAADREAMAVYLKSLPPVEGPPRRQRNSQCCGLTAKQADPHPDASLTRSFRFLPHCPLLPC